MGRLIYGCDICQDVCPWNRRAAVSDAPEWLPRGTFDPADALALWRMADGELASLIKDTPMTRAGVARLRRNLAVALGNAGHPLCADDLDGDADPARPSIADPIVAEHVAWARARLSGTN